MRLPGFLKKSKNNYNKAFGDIGEDIAKSFLVSNGYKILETNFTCKQGEVDIIAQEGEIISFIEVKTRSSTTYGLPEQAVNKAKMNHISNTAKYYIQNKRLDNLSFRADIIAIIITDDSPDITHIINAFPLLS